MTHEELRDLAQRRVQELAADIVWDDCLISGPSYFDEDIDAIHNLIRTATVTLTWEDEA